MKHGNVGRGSRRNEQRGGKSKRPARLRGFRAAAAAAFVWLGFPVEATTSPEVLLEQPTFAEGSGALLGRGLDLEGNLALLSAPGDRALYAYTRSPSTRAWSQVHAAFFAPDTLASVVALGDDERIYYAIDKGNTSDWEVRERSFDGPTQDDLVLQASSPPTELDVDGDLMIAGWRPTFAPGPARFETYERVQGVWTPRVAESFDPPGQEQTSLIGWAVDTDGVRFAVTDPNSGTRGTVRVYQKRTDVFPSVWVLEDEVEYSNPLNPGDHRFGSSVAIEGDCLAVGMSSFSFATLRGGGEPGPGGVQIYRRNPLPLFTAEWVPVEILVPESALDGDGFGTTLAMHGPNLVVGAPNAQRTNNSAPGDVAFFTRSSTSCATGTWTERARLRSEPLILDSTAFGDFGAAVALSDEGGVLVGDPRGPTGQFDGRGYVYQDIVTLFNDGFESGDAAGWSSP